MSEKSEVRAWRVTVLISGSGTSSLAVANSGFLTIRFKGTNLSALLAALPTTLSNCSVTHVLSSRAAAGGLLRASSHIPPIPTSHFSLVTFKKQTGKSREDYDIELARRIRETKPDLVVLAGWMLILSEKFLEALRRDWTEESLSEEVEGERMQSLRTRGTSPYPVGTPVEGASIPIINLHPALPGCFPGAHAIKDAWDAFNAPSLDLSTLSLADDAQDKGAGSTTTKLDQGRITKTGIMIHRVIPLLDAGEPVVVKEISMKEGESLEGLEERIHVVEHKAIVEAVGIVVKELGDGTWWK